MDLKSKKTQLLILGVTAIACSRITFYFFDDSEGPNLLIVIVLAGMLYFLSLATYQFKLVWFKNLLLAILIQIIIAIGLYFYLN